MPTQDRVGLHHEDGPAVTAEDASERGEDRSVGGFEARPDDLALQHGELVAQHQDLDIFGTIPAATQHQQVDHEPDETDRNVPRVDRDRPESGRSDRSAKPQVNSPDEIPAPTRSRQ